MLRPEAWDAWLDPAVGADEAAKLLEAPAPEIVATPVSQAVGSVANNNPTWSSEVPLEDAAPA